MRVLLAVDESSFAAEAAREVENRLAAPGTEVRVLHVGSTGRRVRRACLTCSRAAVN
jgi:hypothetical protein